MNTVFIGKGFDLFYNIQNLKKQLLKITMLIGRNSYTNWRPVRSNLLNAILDRPKH